MKYIDPGFFFTEAAEPGPWFPEGHWDKRNRIWHGRVVLEFFDYAQQEEVSHGSAEG